MHRDGNPCKTIAAKCATRIGNRRCCTPHLFFGNGNLDNSQVRDREENTAHSELVPNLLRLLALAIYHALGEIHHDR